MFSQALKSLFTLLSVLILPITMHAALPFEAKMYRTYFTINEYTPPAEHFKVYTRDSRGLVSWLTVSANSADEILLLPKDKMRLMGTPPFGEQPEIPAPQATPRRLSALERAIRQKIQEYYPNRAEIYVSYLGRARKVQLGDGILMIQEALPPEAPAELRNQHAVVSAYNSFLMFENGGPLSYIEYVFSGGGISSSDFFFDRPKVRFLNYQVPPQLEGRSLLTWSDSIFYNREPYSQKDKATFTEEWLRFSNVVRQTVSDLEQGRYQDPIPAILAKQGDSFLPPGYAAYAELDVQFYGRKPLTQDQADVRRVVRFDIAKAYAEGGTSVSVNVPELGINGRAVLFLSPRTYDVAPENNRIEFTFGVNHMPEVKLEIFAGLDLPNPQPGHETLQILPVSAQLLGEWDHQARQPSRPHGELPGYASYNKIDIYPANFRLGYKVRPDVDCVDILGGDNAISENTTPSRGGFFSGFRRLFSN